VQHSNDMYAMMTRLKGLEECLRNVDGRLSGVEAVVTSAANGGTPAPTKPTTLHI
jgi:hypothetical protein